MKTTSQAGIKVKTGVNGGGMSFNHSRPAAVVRVKSGIKAGVGILCKNHSAKLVSVV